MTDLDIYLRRCGRRLAWLARMRIVALGLATLAALSLAATFAVSHWVPTESWIVAARGMLYAVLAGTLLACLFRRVNIAAAVRHAERRIASFGGRLDAWHDAHRRTPTPALLPQLAKEVSRLAERHPPTLAVRRGSFALPMAMALVAAGLMAWSFTVAPLSWRLPAERLWLGELLGDTRPKIVVQPGNTVTPSGVDVHILARAQGFSADTLRIHASFGDSGQWEVADMLPLPGSDDQEFVLVAVTDPVSYYVSAGEVRTERFRIEVADLPTLEGVDVTLEFPPWTHLASRHQKHGDVAGVAGTQVRVKVAADRPLKNGRLIVDDQVIALDAQGTGAFTIDAAGAWRVAVVHQGETVALSEDFLIDLVDDQPPEVTFAFPGRDRSATAIEEVALRFRAEDDFAVEALTLHYAVNGGDWRQTPGEARQPVAGDEDAPRQAIAKHLFAFEGLTTDDGRALRPGDVMSVYAEAADHRQTTRSALYFVDVRPFDKRYREAQGGGSGGGGDGGLELSARQRDIVAATWNLIRERDAGDTTDAELHDQMDVVAMLQGTLVDQVETLLARAEGRRLSESDEVEPFVAELGLAAPAMTLAAASLTDHDLQAAIPFEQQALQHLLAAEASLRDIDVSLTRNLGSGDAVSRSLSELVDLELDPERNRYEMPQAPSFGQQSAANDDEWRRLTELARRQEELARRQERSDPQLPESRWQLEQLQRELDALRERLSEGSAGQPDPGSYAQDQPSGRQAPAGGQATPSGANGGTRADLGDFLTDMERLRDAIDRSLAENQAEPDLLRAGAAALREGADRLRAADQDTLAGQVRDAEDRAKRLLADQRRTGERLADLQERTLEAARNGRDASVYDFSLQSDAAIKRRMQDELTDIAADLAELRQPLAETSQTAARRLERALAELADSRVGERLAVSAEYLEAGRPLFLVGQEGQIEDALEQFANRLGGVAEGLFAANAAANNTPGVDAVQALRRRLRQTGADGDAGALNEIAEAAERLAAQALEPSDSPALRELRDQTAARYRARGAADANRERLYQMTLAHLDQIEVALARVEGAAIRAQEPRDDGHDSEAVATYFRHLSCQEEC